MDDNDFTFPLTIPASLHNEIERASFDLRQSKSAFTMEAVRRSLTELNRIKSEGKGNESLARPDSFTDICRFAWGFLLVRLLFALTIFGTYCSVEFTNRSLGN